jgi:hypothetical protein
VAAAALAAGCGSTGAGGSGSTVVTPTATLPLATSAGGPGLPGWAAVDMGGSSKDFENFWELFTRPAGATAWKLVTPPGVASNGGLVLAPDGTGLVTGFGPSQGLTFSPLATTAGPAAAWSQGSALVSPGLASVPDALAEGPGGEVLALSRTGEVQLGASGGATWTRLSTTSALARTAAGRACGLTSLTAVAFAANGTPLLAGSCRRPGVVGLFAWEQGTVVAAGPVLPAGRVTVLGLASAAGRTTMLLQTGAGTTASVLAEWSATGLGSWSPSPAMSAGHDGPRSLSLWHNGTVAVVLANGGGASIAGPGASWQTPPAPPAGTATLAAGPTGQLQALVPAGSILSVWQLDAGIGWTRIQQIRVPVPYGSSS